MIAKLNLMMLNHARRIHDHETDVRRIYDHVATHLFFFVLLFFFGSKKRGVKRKEDLINSQK
jgi:hypothetical protein